MEGRIVGDIDGNVVGSDLLSENDGDKLDDDVVGDIYGDVIEGDN